MANGDLIQRVPIDSLVPFADEEITVSDTVKSLTATTYSPSGGAPASAALITSDGDLSVRLQGDDPSATVGHLIGSGNTIWLASHDSITKFKAIRVSTDADIHATYFR